ncbi:MAG TPA: hypothetical protein VGX28_13765 [Frankiaceae bacterium]|jgi:hypothetical protein|nr:hypothetical protein [Frankiaceae bacterium]
MRKSLALLTGAAAVASSFAFGAAPANASHLCEIPIVTVGGEHISIDNPLVGATGVVVVCVSGTPINCSYEVGVQITLNPITLIPVANLCAP